MRKGKKIKIVETTSTKEVANFKSLRLWVQNASQYFPLIDFDSISKRTKIKIYYTQNKSKT